MAMEVVQVEHLAHEHPLMLIQTEEGDGVWDLSCYGCGHPIPAFSSSSSSSYYYGCKQCAFFLHKSCAELPEKMTHPYHPQHPLTLLPNSPYNGYDACCQLCHDRCNGFLYHCSLCKRGIDMKCAFEVLGIQFRIQHPSHDHHLIPLQTESVFWCNACGTKHRGTSYQCTTCGFWINQKCAASPLTVKVNNHHHTLTLFYSVPQPEIDHRVGPLKCQICSMIIDTRNWVYYCSECHYLAHLLCGVPKKERDVFQHFGHDHPLVLLKTEETDGAWDLSCYGCDQPISALSSSSYYGCKQCVFFLHIACAEAPAQMTHPLHDQHVLLRHANASSVYWCEVCTQGCGSFDFYYCTSCNYLIDLKCALEVLGIQESIDHPSHDHKMIPLQKESKFLCHACGREHQGSSYLCTTCGFWINQTCAASPLTIKLNNHPHPLTLIYSVPQEEHDHHFGELIRGRHPIPLEQYIDALKCQICFDAIYRRNWVYYCSECRYLAHLRCAVSAATEHSMLTNNETENRTRDHGLDTINLSSCDSTTATSDVDLHKIIQLPMLDDSADIITQFIKNTATQGKHKGAAEIKHGSHRHTLTLFENPIDHTPSPLNGAWIDGKCIGCAQTISAPFYGCVECKFFLHMWCAELPEELRHPGHSQHPLFLNNGHEVANCKCCDLFGTVLFYYCKECAYYRIDCKCASLPRVIKHESHGKHTLALRPTSLSSTTCISCSAIVEISFECRGCKFNLCGRCALLPRIFRHRYDKHPFTLTYSPLPYRTEDDFCEICEEGIDFNRWFYHCGKCDHYLHTDCIFPIDQFSNMLYEHWPGGTFNSRKHPHRLICVIPLPNESCSLCTQMISDGDVEFKCRPCDFRICSSCKRKEISFRCTQKKKRKEIEGGF